MSYSAVFPHWWVCWISKTRLDSRRSPHEQRQRTSCFRSSLRARDYSQDWLLRQVIAEQSLRSRFTALPAAHPKPQQSSLAQTSNRRDSSMNLFPAWERKLGGISESVPVSRSGHGSCTDPLPLYRRHRRCKFGRRRLLPVTLLP